MYQLLLGVIALFFVGCGPRYVIKNEYIPPSLASSSKCLEHCSFVRQGCQAQCQQNYQYCLDDAYDKAKAVEISELRAYDVAYMRYRMDWTQYQHRLHDWERAYHEYSRDLSHYQAQCEREKKSPACHKRDEISARLKHLKHDRPREPWVPSRPSFEHILAEQQSYCSTNCGCDQAYDGCFVGCGGAVIPHKICVENCD